MFGTVALSRMVALQVGVVTMARSLSLLPTIAFSHRLANRFITRVLFSTTSASPEDAPLIDTKFTDSPSNYSSSSSSLAKRLDASRCGLEPAENTRHCPLVYHEQYSFEGWPENHTFPMDKFARTAHALMTTSRDPSSSTSLPLVLNEQDFFRPLDLDTILQNRPDWLIRRDPEPPHRRRRSIIHPQFIQQFLKGHLSVTDCRRIGFREQTSRPELIRRTVLEVAGTVLTAQLAMTYKLAAHVAGGTHHAHPQGGAGYTILNDLAIATNVVTKNKKKEATMMKQQRPEGGQQPTTHNKSPILQQSAAVVNRVLVIDCDVHQGDGTAKFGEVGQPLHNTLFTLSLHCGSNYPSKKAHSTMDVDLPDKMTDDAYLEILQESVINAVELVQPDLVMYDAGVDIYEHDVLGRLRVTEAGIRQRDFYVLDYCVSRGIPVAAVVGGGYDKDVDRLARRHAIVHEEAARVWQRHQLWERAPRLR